MLETDFLIVGAGIAGASIAYRLASHGRVTLIDMEAQAGYHTTGRSAAFYAETYGGPLVQPLTTASKAFFQSPPEGFADVPLVSPLGAIHVFREGQEQEADRLYQTLRKSISQVTMLSRDEVLTKLPQLKSDGVAGGIFDADCAAIDVAALHQGFLKAAKKSGAQLYTNASLRCARFNDDCWLVETSEEQISARVLVNAAGAWADDVAERAGVSALGLQPLRRTVVQLPNPTDLPFVEDSPIVLEVGSEHYFKPEGRGYLVTPGDEVLMAPCDVQPEEEDVALAAHLFEQATGSIVTRIENKWAGLRTFAIDKAPVIGFASDAPSFFWSVGQGGFGIQTAPAWSELASNLILGQPISCSLGKVGAGVEVYSPARLYNGLEATA